MSTTGISTTTKVVADTKGPSLKEASKGGNEEAPSNEMFAKKSISASMTSQDTAHESPTTAEGSLSSTSYDENNLGTGPATKTAIQLPLISWTLVENEFNTHFSRIFLGRNAKAHFDFLGEVVDGAKERWRSFQLLDALLCAVYNDPAVPTTGATRNTRRVFEHHEVFRHSVVKAIEAGYDEAYGLRKGHIHHSASNITGISCGILSDIRPPWNDFETLKLVFMSHSIEKGRERSISQSANQKRRKGFTKRKDIAGS